MKKTYEISVYNKDVRARITAGQKHQTLAASWADVHLIEIAAHNERDAIAACRRRHPEKLGFILGPALEMA